MKKLVNAGLESGEEFAIRLMRGEVFSRPLPDGSTWSYRFSSSYQFTAKSSDNTCCIGFSPLSFGEDTLANMMTEQEVTLADLIKIKPRLCHVAEHNLDKHRLIALVVSVTDSGRFVDQRGLRWEFAELLTDEEIKQFLIGK